LSLFYFVFAIFSFSIFIVFFFLFLFCWSSSSWYTDYKVTSWYNKYLCRNCDKRCYIKKWYSNYAI